MEPRGDSVSPSEAGLSFGPAWMSGQERFGPRNGVEVAWAP